MVYGAILAGGIGSRMKFGDMPKQFLSLGDKPIIIHTLEKFIYSSSIQRIYVAINKDWVDYFEGLLEKYNIISSRIDVICGGVDRSESLMNVISHIEEKYGVDSEDVIVTHDAVRPFVTERIIKDNVVAAKEYGMCNTAIPATDTISISYDGEYIDSIPDRDKLMLNQTPQSFKIKLLKEMYLSLTPEEKNSLTDATKICTLKGEKVRIVKGDPSNIKITTISDYQIANAVLSGNI